MDRGVSAIELAFDALDSRIAVLDEDGGILYANEAWNEFAADHGVGASAAAGTSYLDSIDPDASDSAARARAGIEAVLDGDDEAFSLTYPCHSPDERRWFRMRASQYREDGQTRVVVRHDDVTERKCAERDRDVSDRRFRAVFDEALDAILVTDDDGRYVEANDAACELFGLDREELLGRSVAEFAPDDYDFESAWESFQTEGRLQGTFPLRRPDGTERIVEFNATASILRGKHVSIIRDVTERRRAERTAALRADELESEHQRLERLLDRVNGLLREVGQVLVQSSTREEIEQGVCDRLGAADSYAFAWVGTTGLRNEALTPQAWAGPADFDVGDTEIPVDGNEDDPCIEAIQTQEPTLLEGPLDGSVLAAEHAAALGADADSESLIAVPLVYKTAIYGVLAVYGEGPDAFDEREQVVLEVLGAQIANAVNELESERVLTTSRVVELEFEIRDPDFRFCALAAAGDCRVEYVDSTYRSDGAIRVLCTAEACGLDAVIDTADAREDIRETRVIADRGDRGLFEMTVKDDITATLADHGAVTRDLTAETGSAQIALDLPSETAARSVFDLVSERVGSVDLVGYRESERTTETRAEFTEAVADELTDRQRVALRTAYFSGYFEWPRPTSGDELAASMGVARPTFHQHLRAAERKVLEELFEGDN